jgi:hypothetical protein
MHATIRFHPGVTKNVNLREPYFNAHFIFMAASQLRRKLGYLFTYLLDAFLNIFQLLVHVFSIL